MLVVGMYFLFDIDLKNFGWKVLVVNFFDFVVMGVCFCWVILVGVLFVVDELWIVKFVEGFFVCVVEYGVDVVGGDMIKGLLNFCIMVIGEVEFGCVLCCDGVKIGD